MGMPQTHDDMEYIEHRVYHDYVDGLDYEKEDPDYQAGSENRSWSPYEQDLSQYPEVFKKYQENYAQYDKVKERFPHISYGQDIKSETFKKSYPTSFKRYFFKLVKNIIVSKKTKKGGKPVFPKQPPSL